MSDSPPNNARTFEVECVELFADVGHALGLPKSVGQIYGLLYASAAPLRFTDIADRLEISKGSISQGIHYLDSIGAVRRAEGGDGGRDRFEPELALRRLLRGVIREQIEPLVEKGGIRMHRLKTLAEAHDTIAARDFQRDQVKRLEVWRHQATLILPLLKTLLASPQR